MKSLFLMCVLALSFSVKATEVTLSNATEFMTTWYEKFDEASASTAAASWLKNHIDHQSVNFVMTFSKDRVESLGEFKSLVNDLSVNNVESTHEVLKVTTQPGVDNFLVLVKFESSKFSGTTQIAVKLQNNGSLIKLQQYIVEIYTRDTSVTDFYFEGFHMNEDLELR